MRWSPARHPVRASPRVGMCALHASCNSGLQIGLTPKSVLVLPASWRQVDPLSRLSALARGLVMQDYIFPSCGRYSANAQLTWHDLAGPRLKGA